MGNHLLGCTQQKPSFLGDQNVSKVIFSKFAEAEEIVIYYKSIYSAGVPTNRQNIRSRATMKMILDCMSDCIDAYPSISEVFSSNTFTETSCDGEQLMLISLRQSSDSSDSFDMIIDISGRCLFVGNKSFYTSSSLLDGIIGRFPEFQLSEEEYFRKNPGDN